MTSEKLLRLIRSLTHCDFEDEMLLMWLSNCENTLLSEVMRLSVEECVELKGGSEEELAVPHPYDKLYLPYMQAQIHHAFGETDKYENFMALYNTYRDEFARRFLSSINPGKGDAVFRGYYLTAYGIAKAHGYRGTEEEWLQSLVGATPELQIGEVTTLGSGEEATCKITGTAKKPVLNIGLPRGERGPEGRVVLPIAKARQDDDGSYSAEGEDLPDVAPGSAQTHVGKGRQMILVPERANAEGAMLSLNGKDRIQIRMRVAGTEGSMTIPVPEGTLLPGVPYTITFCGMYWLVDSVVAPREGARRYLDAVAAFDDVDLVGLPIVDPDAEGGCRPMQISMTGKEEPNRDVPLVVPTVGAVEEMIDDRVGELGSAVPEGAKNVKSFGAVGDGKTDDTEAINAVIESAVDGDVVYFPAGTYLVSSSMSEEQEEDKRFGAIQVVGKSRISIVMSDGAYIKHAKQTTEEVSQYDMTRYYVFNVAGSSDILISGGHVIGEMDEHDYHWFVEEEKWVSGITSTALSDYPGDTVGKAHGYGICVRSSQSVTIRWVDVSKCYGDGVMVSPGSGNKPMGVLIDECVVHDCIRQGVTSAGSDECTIRRCEIYNIRGGLPQSGIDLEPDSIEHSNEGTVIDNCYIHDCASYGLVVTKAARGVVVKNSDIMVRSTVNYIDKGDPVHSVKFENCNLLEINTSNVERNQFVGCTIGAYGSYGLGDTFVDCTLQPEAFDDRVFGFSRSAKSLVSVNTVADTAEIELLSCTMVSPLPAEGEALLEYMFFRNNVQSKRIVMDGCVLRSNADRYFGIRLVGQNCVLRNNHISTDLSHLNEVFLSVAGDSVEMCGNAFDTLCAKSVRDNDGSKNTVSVSAKDILVKDNTFFIAYPLGLRALRTSTSHKPIQRQVVTGNIFHGRDLKYSMSLADATGGSVVCNNIADDIKSAEDLGLVGKDGAPGDDGKDGGFYVPTVTQLDEETVEVLFAPSAEGMPEIPAQRLALPAGKDGRDGIDGRDGADGRDARTPVKGEDYYTPEEKAEFVAYLASELAKRGQLRPEFVNGIEGCTDPKKIYVLPDNMLYAYILTEEQEGGYTNVVDISNIDDPDNSDGFKTKSRLNPSSAVASTSVAGAFVSNVFACKPGDVLRIKGITGTDSTTATAPGFVVSRLKEDGSPVTSVNNLAYLKEHPGVSTTAIQQCWDAYTVDGDGVITWTFAINNSGSNFAALQGQEGTVKIRIGGIATDGIERIIVTVNEPMVEPTVVKRYAWCSTGHAFVPANYEPRILSLEEAADSAKRKMADLQAQIDSGEANAKSGARWFALGDSITEGWASALDGTGYTQFLLSDPEARWVNIVAKKRGYQLTNYGIGGTGYLRTKETTMNARQLVDTLDFAQCDFVTLAYGVNDWKYAVNIGNMNDDIENGGSMVANMRYVIKKILTDNPLCKIFVLTPLNCKSLGTYDTNWGIHYKGTASNGLGLEDIFALQKAVCEYHGIELIDMTHASVVNRENIRGILPDGIHPSAEGHLALANELCGKIKFG